MKNIIIGFSTSKLPISWMIRKATKSDFSHCYIRVPFDKYETSLIFQASMISVNYENINHFLKHTSKVEEYVISITDEQWESLQKFRITEVGKPYSWWQIIGFIFIILSEKLFNKKIKNPLGNGNTSYVCTEIIASGLKMQEAEEMTPEELRQWCIKNGRKILN